VWTYERLLRPVAELPAPDGSRRRVPAQYRLTYEPLETLSCVAALTERVRPGTSVIDALLHPPVVLACRFATLDQFSGGRWWPGWMPQEFETANVPMDRIGAGMDEVVAAMRACWGPDPVEFEGRFYRIADGLNPIAFSAEVVPALAATFRQAAERAGRDPAGLTVVVRANVPLSREPLGDGRPFLGGSARQIAEDLARLEPAGVDEVLSSSIAARDLETEVGLLAELRAAVATTA
jgi:alkanesulfonate monooxygenase SsuD/methylene tetrahydromethanopterin reductase-like flavin-dependent oxidoreductase (luciferase family)